MKKILGLVFGLLFTLPAFATDLDPCRNLFDKNDASMQFAGYVINSDVGATTTLTSYDGGDKTIIIPVKPNTKYTVQRNTNISSSFDRLRICAYNGTDPRDGVECVILANIMNPTTPSATVTTRSDTKYLFINVKTSSGGEQIWQQYLEAFQIEEGETATEYSAYCPPIKVATKKYNDTAFSPVVTALNGAIATIKSVVTNTINQAAAVSALQTGKQTMPNTSGTNGTCPNYKQCLLVETSDGTPQWFVITDPFRDFVTPILATNTNGTTSTNDPGYQQVEYLQSSGTQWIDTGLTSTGTIWNVTANASSTSSGEGLLVAYGAGGGAYVSSVNRKWSLGIIGIQPTIDATVKTVVSIDWTSPSQAKVYINGELKGQTSRSNSEHEVQLLNMDNRYPFVGNLYSVQVTNGNGTIVHNLVPVRRNSDSAIGMYDKVLNTFLPNAGEGTFTAGPDVTNDANVPSGPTWSVTWSNNGNSESGTVYGEGVCNAVAGTYAVAATSANLSASGWSQSGAQCWCKTTGATVNQESTPVSSAPWVFYDASSSVAFCALGCAYYCAYVVRANAWFRSAMFNTGS